MKNTDFASVSAFLRVQEKRLLSGGDIDRVIDAPNADEALRMLSQNSDYDFASLKNAFEYESRLKAELKRVYESAWKLAGDNSELVDILAAKYDFHNVKTAVKAAHFSQRTENPYFYVTPVAPGDIEDYVQNGAAAKSGLPAHLKQAVDTAEDAYEHTQNPQNIDIAVDKALFAYQMTLCARLGNDFISDYMKMSIDFYNIKTLLRVKMMQKGTAFLTEALAPGGKTATDFFVENYSKNVSAMAPVFYYKYFGGAVQAGLEAFERDGNLSALEKRFDDLLVAHTKQAKYLSFGGEILFAYIVSKENEIRQVRIIVTCKQNGIGADALRERLRDTYA
ncbi:MAG: V-type ATPase subunit [Oscillospiraceae bacterium]|nr:V-type ATPase subunit [Oscillospiraceae bacterium]